MAASQLFKLGLLKEEQLNDLYNTASSNPVNTQLR